MIELKSVVDRIDVYSGGVDVRFGLLVLTDGQVTECKWHRTSIPPGGDVDHQMSAVNAHLAEMGKAEVSAEEISKIKAVM